MLGIPQLPRRSTFAGMTMRRRFLGLLGRVGLAAAAAPLVPAQKAGAQAQAPQEHHDLVVIGTGFGGTMTALTIAYTMEKSMQKSGRAAPGAPLPRILMLERGTWWTTPMETIQDKKVAARDFLLWKKQPTQEWSSLGDARGMLDLLRRCRLSDSRPQGLYDFAPVGQRGWLLFSRNDGVSVLRASGVGGGSLIYSKISIRPPEKLFDDPRWPGAWHGSAGAALRADHYRRALHSIHVGIEDLITGANPVGTGPSGIITKSARIAPAALSVSDPTMPPTDGGSRKFLRIQIADEHHLKAHERELIDRARIFQTAMAKLTPHYGTLDLAINDIAPEPEGAEAKPRGRNYCERHGRCNVGCLPGAGQTLNKQIMQAMYGMPVQSGFDKQHPQNDKCLLTQTSLDLKALAEVDHIGLAPDGSYLIHYAQRSAVDPAAEPQRRVISADRVVVAAGTLGTAELMLRSRQRALETNGVEGLPGLSERLGDGFSPNGDHIAFLGETRERVNLTQGPVTTSVGQFAADRPMAEGFHQIEDQGVPRALAALTRHGFEVIRMLAERDNGLDRFLRMISGGLLALQKIFDRSPERGYPREGAADLSADRPESEDELTAKMMCIVAQGKDAADGRFRLEGNRLRVARPDSKPFHEDPIYTSMRASLDRLAEILRPEGSDARFISPLVDAVIPGRKPMVLTSHPLGGCPMGETVAQGVVDESGRVFRSGAGGPFFRGLYIADGSVIPSALGVNPSLTIAAVALRTADKILDEWNDIPARGTRGPAPLECTIAN